MVSLKELRRRNEFEMFVVLSTIRLKGGADFFIRDFLEVFYFPSDFIVAAKSFLKEIFEKFQF